MTRPPCEEITHSIKGRLIAGCFFFKRTCNTHPWISNEILGSRLRPGIIYSKVCIVKWFPLIKCTLTKRLKHFFPYNLCHRNSVVAFFFFFLALRWRWLNDDCDPKKGIGRHIWHLQYAWPNTDAVPCLQFPVASLIPHRQTLRDRELGGPACLPATPVSPLACLLTFWYFSLHPVCVCVCPCVCVLSLCVCVCVCVFLSVVPQHAEEQRLSQTITPCDGSVLLHSEMKLKCLIDFSFTFLTSGGNISQCMQLQLRVAPPPSLRGGPAFSLWRGVAVLYSRHVFLSWNHPTDVDRYEAL